MDKNSFETQYDVTKKSKLGKFYEENKVLIFSTVLILVIAIVSISYYFEVKEKKKILLAESYIEAKVYSENGDRNKAKNILKTIIFANDSTYSTLSLFLILNESLIIEQNELLDLFDQVLKNNKFEKEVRNLIIFKKALFQSNFVSESELLEAVNPLINTETLWKPHALLLLGDYFFSKKEYFKAKEFYIRVLSLKDLHKDLYKQATSQIMLIVND
jgi:predicted negative regulator of RcsB-dependent stress response|tara:strand:- start:38 stop:685 length:648 start_codon:yes stop_codon:yes gene_type:complete